MQQSKATKAKRLVAIMLGMSMLATTMATMSFGNGQTTASADTFTTDMTKEETLAEADKINQEVASEGMVLLKNGVIDDKGTKALPVEASTGGAMPWDPVTTTGVSVFGKHAGKEYFVYSGGVSSGSAGTDRKDIYDSLEAAGYKVNPTLKEFYSDDARSGGGGVSSSAVTETPIESLTEAEALTDDTAVKYEVTEEVSNPWGGTQTQTTSYKDVAIVVISRTGGENSDLSLNNGEGKHMLELSNNEIDLLKHIKTLGFKRTVVVINAIAFEMDFVDNEEYGVDAAIWVSGGPGRTGMMTFGKILSGEVNPSGKLVDIYYRDFLADPTSVGFSDATFGLPDEELFESGGWFGSSKAGDTYTLAEVGADGTTTYREAPADSRANGFSAYNEGIYYGYRYYETIASDIAAGKYVYMNGEGEDGELYKVDSAHPAKTDKAANAADWYDDAVVYPFGYGLSYTEFDWELVSQSSTTEALTADGKIEVQVKVTNTGSVAGKDVVQLYYGAPYIEGGIEKAAVNLGDYAKTDLLEPGQSQTLTLSLKVRDMASYDFSDANKNGFMGYELDAGTYNIFIGKDSNDCWSNPESIKISYTVGEGGLKITHSEYTNYEIKNQFDHSVGYEGILQQMSRADMVGTFPHPLTKAERAVTQEYLNTIGYNHQAKGQFEEGYDEGKPYQATTVPTQAETPYTGDEEGLIMLYELMDTPKDDPKWEKFMDQFTVEQLKKFVLPEGMFDTEAVPALGVPRMIEADGPYGFVGASSNELTKDYTDEYMFYYSSSALAGATWNDELIERQGEAKGLEGLVHGVNAIYAPGCNTHRSLFEGRNSEYYSEDPLLNGRSCAAEIRGLQSKGVIAYVKHFAVREEERESKTTRNITEQALREIYLKPFQIAVEEGKTLGIMVSNNPIGETWWCGADYGLCTEVLRNEWGFEGINITDWAWGEYSNNNDGIKAMLVAGTDKLMSGGKNVTIDEDDATMLTALRNAAKNVLFAVSRSNAMPEYLGDHNIYASGENFSTKFESTSAVFTEVERTYNITGDIPDTMTISEDGVLSGNAEAATPGKYEIVVESLIDGVVYRKDTVNIYISGLEYEGGAIAGATAGEQYVGSVATANSIYAGGVSYKLVDGALPEGLTLDGNGMITGTPTTAGEYTFTIAADAKGEETCEAEFTITVAQAQSPAEQPDYDQMIDDLKGQIEDLQAEIDALRTADSESGSGCAGNIGAAQMAMGGALLLGLGIAVVVAGRRSRKTK